MNYKARLARLDIKITTGMEHTYCTSALCSESPRETVLQSTSQANRKGADTVNRKGRVIVSDVVYGLANYKYTETFTMQCERAFAVGHCRGK